MINKSLQKTIDQTFLQLLVDLKDKKEITVFLKGLMGEKEYNELVKKLAVIYWLRKNRPTDIIKNNLDVNDKYIDSIKPLINKPGIKLAIKYMEAEEFANVWAEKIKKFQVQDIKIKK
jgi:uncharacterized protein YerC